MIDDLKMVEEDTSKCLRSLPLFSFEAILEDAGIDKV